MPLSELVVLLQQPPATVAFSPSLLLVVSWPPIDYIPAALPKVPVVIGGPPAQTNWFAPLAVTPWPSPQYQPVAIPGTAIPTTVPSSFVPTLLSNTVVPWPSPQYQAAGPAATLPGTTPGTGPFFPRLLDVTPWAAPQYQPQDLLHVPPVAGTASSTAFAGVKILLRGVKRRKLI